VDGNHRRLEDAGAARAAAGGHVDGNPELQALGRMWPAMAVRCCMHELRNLKRKAPKHALAELREDFHRIVYAASGEARRTGVHRLRTQWAKRCPDVLRARRTAAPNR
jgi:transposase-like protein